MLANPPSPAPCDRRLYSKSHNFAPRSEKRRDLRPSVRFLKISVFVWLPDVSGYVSSVDAQSGPDTRLDPRANVAARFGPGGAVARRAGAVGIRSNPHRSLRKHRRSPRPKRSTYTAAEAGSRHSSRSSSSWLSSSVSWRSAPGVSGSSGRIIVPWRCPSVSRRTSRQSFRGNAYRRHLGASRRRSSTARAAPLCN